MREDRPRRPASFHDIGLDGCTFRQGSFAGVSIIGARLDGMTIDGWPVEDMIELYRRVSESGASGP